MISRVHCVGAALLALLTAAPACFAQESTPPAAAPVISIPADTIRAVPADTVRAVADTAVSRPVSQKSKLPLRRASIGGSFGGSWFWADKDYAHARNPDGSFGAADVRQRLSFQSNFRYRMTTSWAWQIAVGYTWSGYKDDSPIPFTDPNFPDDQTKDEFLTEVLPLTGQLQYTMDRKSWVHHIGVGPGAYRVWVQNNRKVLQDPATTKRHSGFYPGVSGEIGSEYFLKSLPSVAIEFAASTHWIFAQRDEQFPSGFNSFLAFTDLRVGATYHFNPIQVGAKKKPGDPVKPAGQ